MALEDLGGPAAHGGGLQVDPAEAETMRDRALAQYMQRKEEFDRLRQQEAQRHGQHQTPQAEPQAGREQQPVQLHSQRGPSAQRWASSREEDPELDELQERLGDLPGLTRTKMEALLNEFDSLEALEQADEQDLVQVEGIGQRLAAKIVHGLQ